MQIQDKLLTINKYSRPGTRLTKVKKIVIHWVGNATSTAINNRNYFENLKNGTNKVYASSHYIIGLKGEIIRCVPENEVAYHASDANIYSIGIECCHPDWDGRFADATYKALIDLVADLCTRYNLNPQEDVLRHYDITGKDCPRYYVSNKDAWKTLKQDVYNKLKEGDEMLQKEDILVNGVDVQCDTILKDGITYMSLRQIAELLGAEVTYDSKTKKKGIKTARA